MVLPFGVSQISGGSRTSVGGYDKPEIKEELTTEQFDVSDTRSLDEVVLAYKVRIYSKLLYRLLQGGTNRRQIYGIV